MKIRIKFRKYGVMKFIGHLDIMRYFQKAMRRAEIDIKYSEGFSPHQIMSFAAPLGVGLTSVGEYLDIEVNTTKSSPEALKDLNENMVEGIEVVSYIKLPDDAKTAMSLVAAADYKVYFKDSSKLTLSLEDLNVKVKAFYEEPQEIFITKKTKKSEKVMDLKQLVYDFHIEDEGVPFFFLRLSTGSTDNVKPELVLEAFCASFESEFHEHDYQVHRLDVYTKSEAGFLSLGHMGEEIE